MGGWVGGNPRGVIRVSVSLNNRVPVTYAPNKGPPRLKYRPHPLIFPPRHEIFLPIKTDFTGCYTRRTGLSQNNQINKVSLLTYNPAKQRGNVKHSNVVTGKATAGRLSRTLIHLRCQTHQNMTK